MATPAQIEANRLNAQKSTGPKTPEGKEAVAQNALKHGLLARRFFIGPDQKHAFAKFRDSIRNDLTPAGALQSALADRIADLAWRLRQSQTLYHGVVNVLAEKTKNHLDMLYQSPVFDTPQDGEDYLLASAVITDFEHHKVLDKLALYERRLERSLFAAQKEYRALRAFRAKEEILKAQQMDRNDDADYRTPQRPARPEHANSEQTKPIRPGTHFANPLPTRYNSDSPEFPDGKTNPNSRPDPLRNPEQTHFSVQPRTGGSQ